MPDLRLTTLALLLVAPLVACGDDNTSTTAASGGSASASTAESSSTADDPAPADPGKVIPDGSYAKTATLAEARGLGIRDKGFLHTLGEDGKTSYVFKFQGDRWAQFVVEDAPDTGDLGTLEYDESGDLVLISASDECPGCVTTYDWAVDGDVLTLSMAGHESTGVPEAMQIARFVTEGTFDRQS